MYDYQSVTEEERLKQLQSSANQYNKNLPPDAKEYWVVDGEKMQLKKIPRQDMVNVVSVGRAMRM